MAENKKVIISIVVDDKSAKKNLNEVEKSTKKAGQAAEKANKGFLGLGKTFGAIARGFVIVKSFQLLARAITSTIKVGAEFEQTMAKVRAISGATDEEFKKLEKSARELALGTIFTATQVGELQLAYSKLGFTTEEILNATEATLNLATATGEDLASAADVVGSTIRGFNLDASEATRVTDVMAKSFSSSALNLESFKQSMKTVAPIASAANVDLETTTALLGTLADSGLRGTRAATGLKNLMSQLTDPTSKLANSLGYTIENSEGLIHAFRDLSEKNIDLAEATGLTDERSKAAFITLINGTSNIDDLKLSLDNASGSAESMASIIGDTLVGSFKTLESQWQETQIAITNSDALKNYLDALSVTLVALREGTDAAAELKFNLLLSKDIKEDFKDVLAQEKKFFKLRAESNKAFAEGNKRIFDEVKDKELASQAVRDRNLKKRKEQSEELKDFRLSQIELLNKKYEELSQERNKMEESEFTTRTAIIEESIKGLQKNLETATDPRLIAKYTEGIEENEESLKRLAKEQTKYVYDLQRNDGEYQRLIERMKKLNEAKKEVEAKLKDTKNASSDLSKEIDGLNKITKKGAKDTLMWGAAWALAKDELDIQGFQSFGGAFEEQFEGISDLADPSKMSTVADGLKLLEEQLTSLTDAFAGGDVQTQETLLARIFGTSDQDFAAIKDRLVEYSTELVNIGFDLLNVQLENRLNALERANELELNNFDKLQKDKASRFDIEMQHQLDSFVGTEQQKADFEKQKRLEQLEFEQKQEREREALRKKQIEKENKVARNAFLADKANSLANIAIQTALGIIDYANNPVTAPLVPFVIATGAAQTAVVASQRFQPKTYQDGGMIQGDSHANGGVPFTVAGQAGFEAEGGEYIFSRKTVNRLGVDFLDSLNFGSSRQAPSMMFANGGGVPNVSRASSVNEDRLAEKIGMQVAMQMTEIPVVNVATETAQISRGILNAEAMATL